MEKEEKENNEHGYDMPVPALLARECGLTSG
jgi:hypothetical protein